MYIQIDVLMVVDRLRNSSYLLEVAGKNLFYWNSYRSIRLDSLQILFSIDRLIIYAHPICIKLMNRLKIFINRKKKSFFFDLIRLDARHFVTVFSIEVSQIYKYHKNTNLRESWIATDKKRLIYILLTAWLSCFPCFY